MLPTAANFGANMDIVGPSTQNNTTPNTLRFNTANNSATNMTVTLSGVNVLQGSGILVTSGLGTDVAVINGTGSLSGGAGVNSDLRIYQNNTLAPLDISAVIANLAPTSRSGTAVSGTSIITGVNVAGLAPGLTVSGTGIASGSTITSIDSVNGTITLSANTTASGTNPISFTPVANGLSKSGVGNLILSGLNTYTGVNSLNGGVLTVRQLSVEGFAPGSVLTTQNVTTTKLITLTGTTTTTGLTFGQTVTGTGLPPVVSLSTNTPANSNVVVVSSTAGLSNGLPVVGTGIPAGAVITLINGNNVTISANATATNTGTSIKYGGATIAAINSDTQVTLTNGSTISATQDLSFGQITAKSGAISSTTINSSNTVTVASTAGLTPGQAISGPNIPVGAVIATIIDGTRFTMSLTATGNGTNSLTYADPTSLLKTGLLTSITTSSARLVVPSTIGLTLGQTVSGAGIPAGSVIIRIVDGHSIDISNPVTSTGTNSITFSSPTVLGATLAATTTSGSTTVTFASSVAGLAVGQKVTGPGIPVGTTIAAILSGTQIVLSNPVQFTAASSSLVFAGPASNLGSSSNAAANFILNNGTFQYNGLSASSDRGFTINADGVFDVGNAYTRLILAGSITTPAAEENYRIIKLGAGMLELRGTLTPGATSYGISGLVVNDGTLRLNATFNDQFVRNDVGTLTVGGGALELVGAPDRATSQNMIGTFSMTEGASVITVSNVLGSNQDTTLNLQDIANPSKVSFGTGSTGLFVENHNGTGDANITLAGLFGIDVQVVLPRITYQTSIDIKNPGVNYFAFVDSTAYSVVASDNISIGGATAHTIVGNPANWQAYMNVMDGALSFDAFSGTTLSNASINTIRFFNSSIARGATFTPGSADVTNVVTTGLQVGQLVRSTSDALDPNVTYTIIAIDAANNKITLSSPSITSTTVTTDSLYVDATNASTITIADTLTINQGAILQTTHAGNHVNSITGGVLTSALNNSDGTSADLIIHNWNPSSSLNISSVIANNASSGMVVNLIQTGNGTTELTGANTYTGVTYVQGGVLRLDSSQALPQISNVHLEGGVLGIGYNSTFQRFLGTGAGQVTWVSSGGFAAYSSPLVSTTTINSGSVTVASTTGLSVGNAVSGPGIPVGANVLIETSNATDFSVIGSSPGGVTISGAISGGGGFTLAGGGTVILANPSNSYGTNSGSTGAAVDGATIIRNGILVVGVNGALSGSTIELGDSTFSLAGGGVAVATNGASVLGVDRNTVGYTSDNLGSLGGSFVANGNGLVAGNGDAIPGAGAFYNIGTTIDARTFTVADVGQRILVKDEAASLERNGVYQITQFNADGTMNMVRVTDFSTTANMLHGTQVAVSSGTSAGTTYFLASQSVTSVNTAGTNPVIWQVEGATINPTFAVLQVTNPAVTSITQNIDVNAGAGTLIYAANPVTFSGNVSLQNLQPGVAESQELFIESTGTGAGAVFSGVISESASEDLLTVGINDFNFKTGNVTFTGSNTYKGGTLVTAGTLFVNNAPGGSGTGSGSVQVSSGATLAGTGSIALASGSNVTINSGGTISVGLPGDTTGKQFTIALQTGTSFTMKGAQTTPSVLPSALLKLDLFSNSHGTNPTAASDQLVFTKTGSPSIDITGATLQLNNVNNLTPSSFTVGDSWKLIDWAGISPTGKFSFTNLNGNYTTDFTDLPALASGFMWDISQLYAAGTIVVAVPEPERLLLMILSLMALGWRRRRRRTV